MKYGYACKCGWKLGRGRLGRRDYALDKEAHAEKCESLRKELKESGKTVEAK